MFKTIGLIFLFFSCVLSAQSTGIIFGTVNDENGLPAGTADVFINGTIYSAFTDENGYYELEVEPGIYHVTITSVGYEENTQNITIGQNERVEYSTRLISAVNSSTQLTEAVVIGETNKESEASLLNLQKKAVITTESIGAKELDRKGVSDVANAVTKVSGISRQEGSNVVYIRGLGDRYNSTTMNGLPIPSNDPEYKNIDLSIFPTDIVEYVGIDKVYSGIFFGDFAGGNVNIITKSQTGKSFFKVGLTGRINTNAFNNDKFRLKDGPDFSGFKLSDRMPNSISTYDFDNSFNPQRSPTIGNGMLLSGGNRFDIGQKGKFGIFALAAFDNDYKSIDEGFVKAVNTQGVAKKDFHTYNKYEYNTNSTGLLGLNYKINSNNNLKFNSLFINSSNEKQEEYLGYIVDVAENGKGFIRRGTFVRNQLWINQLMGMHKLSDRWEINWTAGYNTIDSDMPDRVQNTFVGNDLGYVLGSHNSVSSNNRYFQTLNENEFVGNASVDYKFAKDVDDAYRAKITIGYNGRIKKRDLQAYQFNFKVTPGYTDLIIDTNHPDSFFNQSNYSNGYFTMSTFSGENSNNLEPAAQFYNGKQDIHGGFLNLEYKFSSKFTAVLGLRGEYVNQWVEWHTNLSNGENKFDQIEFLPSLNLKYELTQKQNLRFSASKTYTLPQFKERALFQYEEPEETTGGWASTYPSTDYNADLKWELFPGQGELISVAGFGKYIQDPINKLFIASAGNDLAYANTGDWAYVFGGELEVRKSIIKTETNNPIQLTAGANISYLHSNQELNSEKIYEETLLENGSRLNANFTHDEAPLQGASDLLLNGDLSFTKEWQKGGSIMATVAYNYFSGRIYAIGTEGRGNVVEKGVGTLDFILRTKLNKNIGINLNAQNLLDPDIDRVQENTDQDITVRHYKKGRNFSLSINYEF
jgi:hypothetical protein